MGRQSKATADVLEQNDAELGFQGLDLSRCGRLTEVQNAASAAKPAQFGGHDESAKRAKADHCCAFCMIIEPIFAFDTRVFADP